MKTVLSSTKYLSIATLALPAFFIGPATTESTTCPDPGSDLTYTVSQVDQGVDAVECGIVGEPVKSGENVSVAIPEPGSSVRAIADGANTIAVLDVGVNQDGTVSTATDGGLVYQDGTWVYSDDPEFEWAFSDSLDPCNDGQYRLIQRSGNPLRWWKNNPDKFNYRINSSTIPDYLNVDNVREAIRDGVNNTFNGNTDCPSAFDIPAHRDANYAGDTDSITGIDRDPTADCHPDDGHSVIGFGPIDNGYLALTCTYTDSNNLIHTADTRYTNNVNYHWVAQWSSSCRDRNVAYVIHNVAAHESGHMIGLDDLTNNSHANLTMYGDIQPCERKKQTLGRGDRLALKEQYE